MIIIQMIGVGILSVNNEIPLQITENEESSVVLNISGESYEEEWINNTGFDNTDFWYWESSGDSSDVDAEISGGQANNIIVGESLTYTYAETEIDASNWTVMDNPTLPFRPDAYSVDTTGFQVTHEWVENSDDGFGIMSSIHWKRNISLPTNMSDYEITGLSIDATINGSGFERGTSNGAIERPGDLGLAQEAQYDRAKFYIRISDIDNTNNFEFAYNYSDDIGIDQGGDTAAISYQSDTGMISLSESTLITLFSQILATGDNQNFTMTVGIDVLCEDNYQNDDDYFLDLRVKDYNFTFSCTKKIDQLTSVSWKQDGLAVPNGVQIDNASLNFRYKIDSAWPTTSPNAEFRILINENPFAETIKLSEANGTFQWAKNGGLDIKSLIAEGIAVNLSIQTYLADNFILSDNITLSIDDVSLNISYTYTGGTNSTDLVILLQGLEEPTLIVPLGTTLNITVKYLNQTDQAFLTGATVSLSRLGYSDPIPQNGFQYTILLDVDTKLLESTNLLKVTATKLGYESQIDVGVAVTVRKINTTITCLTGINNILNIVPESNASLKIKLFNEDSQDTIKNVSVSYNSATLGSGTLSDNDQNGIYECVVENVPEGNHDADILIAASDNYDFDDFSVDINANASLLIPTTLLFLFNGTNYTANPTISVPIGSTLNVTAKYTNSSDFIANATVQLTRQGFTDYFIQNATFKQYSLILNVDEDLQIGLNDLSFSASKIGFVTQTNNPEITVRKRFTLISSLTGSNTIAICPNENATLQVNISDTDFGGTIKNLTVTYSGDLGSGVLSDDNNDGIYEVTFISVAEELYQIPISISPHENYSFSPFQMTVNSDDILQTLTTLSVFLNSLNMTTSPVLELPIGSTLNITVMYNNITDGSFISGATVQLSRQGYTDNFVVNGTQYTLILDVDEKLLEGLNLLGIYAYKIKYDSKSSSPSITIRKIQTLISSESGSTTISICPNENTTMLINITDTDFNGTIKGLTVTYSSATLGSGLLTDLNSDGIYEAHFTTVVIGTHIIQIAVSAHDNYTFSSSFQMTIVATTALQTSTSLSVFLNGNNMTAFPTLSLPITSTLNITVKYTNPSGVHIPNAVVKLTRLGYIDDMIENPTLGQYSVIINVDNDLARGINLLEINAYRVTYDAKISSPSITIRKIYTQISSNSGVDTLDVKPELDANIKIVLSNLDFGGTVKNMTVTYDCDLGTGVLTDADQDGIYELVLKNVPVGNYPIQISVLANENYEFGAYVFTLNALNSLLDSATVQLLLNDGAESIVEIPIGSTLKVGIKYTDASGQFISGAKVQMERLGFMVDLVEDTSLQQYTLILDVDADLAKGLNQLKFHAKKIGYQLKTTDSRVTIRKIHTKLSSETGSNRIDIKPDDSFTLKIRLNNTDQNITIKNATVAYFSSTLGSGSLTDVDENGVFEIRFNDVPEGSHTVTITVYASDSYVFENYVVTIAAQRSPAEIQRSNIILIVGLSCGVVLTAYVIIYNTKLKYPPEVQKLRKLRKAIKKGKKVKSSVDVPKREENIAQRLVKEIEILGLKNISTTSQTNELFMTQADQKKIVEDKAKMERLSKEKAERERAEKEKIAKENVQKENLKKERELKKKAEKEKAVKVKAAKVKAEKDKAAKIKAEKDKAAKVKSAKVKAEKDKAAKVKAEKDKAAKVKAEKDKAAKIKAEKDKAAKIKAEKEKAAKNNMEKTKIVRNKDEKTKIIKPEKNKLDKKEDK
jgi:hypothetical protein